MILFWQSVLTSAVKLAKILYRSVLDIPRKILNQVEEKKEEK